MQPPKCSNIIKIAGLHNIIQDWILWRIIQMMLLPLVETGSCKIRWGIEVCWKLGKMIKVKHEFHLQDPQITFRVQEQICIKVILWYKQVIVYEWIGYLDSGLEVKDKWEHC